MNSYRIVSTGQYADERTQEVVRFYTERGQCDKLRALTSDTPRVDAEP